MNNNHNNILYFNLLVITVISSIFYINNTRLESMIISQKLEIKEVKEKIYIDFNTLVKDNNNLKEELLKTQKKQNDLIYLINELGTVTTYMKELNQRVNELSEHNLHENSIKRRLTDLESNDIVLENKLKMSNKFLEKNILENTNKKIDTVVVDLQSIIEKIKLEAENTKNKKIIYPRYKKKKYSNKIFLRDYLLNNK